MPMKNFSNGLVRYNGPFVLLPFEDKEEYAALQRSLAREHQPNTPTEQIFVTSMAESIWLAKRAQTLLTTTCLDPQTGKIADPKSFSLYLRYQAAHERAFHKSHNELLKLRAQRQKQQAGFEAQKRQQAQREADLQQQKYEAEWDKDEQVAAILLQDAEFMALSRRREELGDTKSPEREALDLELDRRWAAAEAKLSGTRAQAA